MALQTDFSGLERLIRKFYALENPDGVLLMRSWERIIDEDNRKGILAGTDKDGGYMIAVTYRPKLNFLLGKMGQTTKEQRLGLSARKKRGVFAGYGPSVSGLNNNLTSAEYRRLNGPPLAPRKGFSRVITNLFTASGRDPAHSYRWEALAAWREVVSTKGVHFLKFHFTGTPRLPMRDLRGVRPEGMSKARKALIEWMKSEIRRAH